MLIYEQQLGKKAANFAALSPVSFVELSDELFGDLRAVVHGARRYTWRRRASEAPAWRLPWPRWAGAAAARSA